MDTTRRRLIASMAGGAFGLAAMTPRRGWSAVDEPVTETSYGRVRGFSRSGVEHFLGIPYGGSVSGSLRFHAPRAPDSWAGVRDTQVYGPPSIQPPGAILSDSKLHPAEDCLFLNVWTPASDSRRRPVMFYNHGGGFTTGSGSSKSQDGANLARLHDVVVVESNHRLGLLGYLHLADLPDARHQVANVGLLDLAAALRWVQENIENFGGDPGKVMIFGESGGGAKTACLYGMPSAISLFHRASIESAPTLRVGTREGANQITALVLGELGIAPADWRRLFKVAPETLLAVQQRLTSGGALSRSGLSIQPIVDGEILPAHPFDPAAPKFSSNKPLLVGYNHDETVFISLVGGDKSIFSLDDAGLISRLSSQLPNAKEAIAVYRESRPMATPSQLYIAITTAMFAGTGAVRIAERKAAQGGAPVYAYIFNFQVENRVPGTDYPLGAMHAIEIPFKFFNMENITSRGPDNLSGNRPERFQAGRNMSGLWSSFARRGVPSEKGVPTWTAYETHHRNTMVIDTDCKLVSDPNRLERQFWQSQGESLALTGAGPR